MSEHVSILLEQLFFNETFSMRRHGATLDLGDDSGGMVTLFADHTATLADALALEEVLLNKGHSGTKPCPICRNVVDHKRGYAEADATGYLQPMTSIDMRTWKAHTDESVLQLARRLVASQRAWQEGRITKKV